MRLHDRAGRVVEAHHGAEADAARAVAHHAHLAAPLGHEPRGARLRVAGAGGSRGRVAPRASRGARPVAAGPHRRRAGVADRGRGTPRRRGGADPARPDGRGPRGPRHRRAHRERARRVEHGRGVRRGAEPGRGVVVARARRGAHPVHRGADRSPPARRVPTSRHDCWPSSSSSTSTAGRASSSRSTAAAAVELARTTGDVELLREVMMLRLVASAGSWDAAGRLELAEELLDLGPADELGGDGAVPPRVHPVGLRRPGRRRRRHPPQRRGGRRAAAQRPGDPAGLVAAPPGHATSTTRRTTA